jgi:DNA-binding NarL/FixJ family response regulator
VTSIPPAQAAPQAPGQTTRILLVDDQALLRVGMRMVLEAEPGFEVVSEAGDGREAIRAARSYRPDVILMDVRMPVLDGIEATREIVRELPASRVIILTTFDLDEYAFAGLRAGASGFLLKDTRPAELALAIRSVASGDAAISPRVTRELLTMFGDSLPDATGGAGQTASAARLAVLTEREREVLTAIGEGLSNTEIAARFVLSESTVKTHVGRILQKLELRDRVHAVILAYETGIVGR